jgi:hypothetical protein
MHSEQAIPPGLMASASRMKVTPFLSLGIQFAFTNSLRIIFSPFAVGLAAWCTFLEAREMISKKKIYRSVGFCIDPPGPDPIVKTPVTVRRITDVG